MWVVVRPVQGRRDLREFIELPYRLHSTSRVWVPPLRLERHLFLMRAQQRVLHARRRAAVPGRARRPRGRPHQRPVRRRLQRLPRQPLGACSASSSSRTTRRSCRALLAAAEDWLRAHGRDHMIGPMDFTMNDERGVHDRGLRADAVHQAAVAPALLPAALRGGRARQGDGPAHVGARDRRPREDPADHLQARRARSSRATASRLRKMSRRSLRSDMDRFAEVYNSAWSENWGFVAVLARRDLDAYAQELQLVFDRNWFMVAETADGRDRRRSRSRCPTSTRC